MGFNYAKEKAKFDRQWAELRKQYEQLGMSPYSIQQIYDFDWDWFKSRRRYCSHQADLPKEIAVETIQQASTETSPGGRPASFGTDPNLWVDEIEDEQLLRKLTRLSQDDIALLTLLVFKECTQSEVAQSRGQTQQSISWQLRKIKKILGECL